MRITQFAFTTLNLINKGFDYVIKTSETYKIDESHALKHSMEVYNFAKNIYETEIEHTPFLERQKDIIYMAAIGHDMCDKKYMNEKDGISNYQTFLSGSMTTNDLEVMGQIINTMSYSKVKVNGYPFLGEYQMAYHIVREADLLSGYDIDRCIIYNMFRNYYDYTKALQDCFNLFHSRVFTMIEDNLFTTDFAKNESLKLHEKAKKNLEILYKL
jgi:hypothetical protein